MIKGWHKSITTRTLIQIAVAVGLIILGITYVTYELVFHAIAERTLINLNQYLVERTKRQEESIAAIEQNMRTAREAYIQRYRQVDPPGFLDQWDYYFEKCKDGGWRSKYEFSNDYEYAPLWGHKDIGPSKDVMRRILIMFEVCQRFLPGWVHNFRSLYGFTSDEMVLVGFDPTLPGWIYYQPSDYNVNVEEFGRLAFPENNPAREFAWTGATSNDGSGKSLVSVVLPIDLDKRHVMTIGHDLQVDNLVEETARDDIQGITHVIFRQDGRIIAHPALTKEIFKGNGKFKMQTSGDPTLEALYPLVINQTAQQFSGYEPRTSTYYAAHRIAGPDWIYLAAMPRSVLREQAFRSTRWVLWSALAMLACELALLGIILRRTIARPINELVDATRRLAAGETNVALEMSREDEIGVLAGAFNDMVTKVREEKASLEGRVAQRTTELSATNESLRQSEHDLAQALVRQTELVQLKSDFVSLVSHEFRTPLEIITSSAFNLDRYHERLPAEKRSEMLDSIQRAVRRMASMMEQVLLLGRINADSAPLTPVPIDLPALCREVVDEIETTRQRRGDINLEIEGSLAGAVADDTVLRHLLANLLSNALKYSPPGSCVRFTLHREGGNAVFMIADSGCGIPEADQARLFEAFRRGGNVGSTPGTGLGLVIVRRCLDLQHGRIACESKEGVGTIFTVYIPVFPSTAL